MSWRLAAKKVSSTFTSANTSALPTRRLLSRCYSEHTSILRSEIGMPASSDKLKFFGVESRRLLTRWPSVRCIHSSLTLLTSRNSATRNSDMAPKRKKYYGKKNTRGQPPVDARYVPKIAQKAKPGRTIDIFEGMTVGELSKRIGMSIPHLQDILINVGEKAYAEFDSLSIDAAELVAMEVGVSVKRQHTTEGTEILPRPPVVTVMGHVDHGKTSLLDALRETSVAAKEAGGITQHIGAFVVRMPSGAAITFLDTPGHAAFSAMRARGAAVTDIVVLVVAADDGVMPQTLEAMSHAKDADVPIVVAINKCDKPGANPERVKIQLASEGLTLEEMGGDVQVVEVSAVKKTGLDNLEEVLLLQSEMMELKARVDGSAQAYVVEARVDKGRGPLVTAIVKAGTLVRGQHVVVGAEWGRIRALRDTAGVSTDKAMPAMPVEIEGLKGLPRAGDDIVVVESEERAKMLSEGRKQKLEKDRLMKTADERAQAASAEEEEDMSVQVKKIELPIIVKADVQGTVQAVTDALRSLNSSQVFVNVVHVGVGPVTQSDVDLAVACEGCIVGFNVKNMSHSVSQAAAQAHIKIILHSVIYHLLKDIGELIVEKAPGTPDVIVAGEAHILNTFEIMSKTKTKEVDVRIAGCRVVEGEMAKESTMRLLRSGEVLFEGPCASLKIVKQDVDTVVKGKECGIVIQDCLNVQIGDVIQCLKEIRRKPKFISSDNGAVRIQC